MDVTQLCKLEEQKFVAVLVKVDFGFEFRNPADYFKHLTGTEAVVLDAVPYFEGRHRVWNKVGVDYVRTRGELRLG